MEKKAENLAFRDAVKLHGRAFREIRQYCPGVFSTIAAHSALKAISPYVTIYLSSRIINELAGAHRAQVLWPLVGITLLSAMVLHLLTGILFRRRETMDRSYDLRKNQILVDKMMSMDFADVDDASTLDMLKQINQNEQWCGMGLHQLFYQFENGVEGILGVLGAVVLTVSLFTLPVPETAGAMRVLNHPGFAAVVLVVLVLAAAAGSFCTNQSFACWSKCAEEARLSNRIFGAFAFIFEDEKRALDFRIYNQMKIIRHYIDRNNAFLTGGSMARSAKGPIGLWRTLGTCISGLFTGFVYLFVCLKAWAGAFGVGSVTQYVGAVTALTNSLSLLLQTAGEISSNAPFLKLTYDFLDIPNSMYQGSLTTEKRSDRQYEVEFRDVSFRYPGSDIWALRHVSMKFKVGKRLAIVGENGSGKTTFIKLLCRLYDPQEGEILLNGIDIRKYRYSDYMGVFSVVFQDFQLLAQSLGSNVASAQAYDRQRVQGALIDAGFGERLDTMPEGLDTQL